MEKRLSMSCVKGNHSACEGGIGPKFPYQCSCECYKSGVLRYVGKSDTGGSVFQVGKASEEEAKQELVAAGAKLERKEDREGRTRSGWWLDDVFLGKTAREALSGLRG